MPQCLRPRRIINPRYKKIARVSTETRIGSSRDSPISYRFVLNKFRSCVDFYIDVPCGLCLHCLKNRASDWRRRLLDEYEGLSPEQRARTLFVTMSIDPEHYDFVCSNPSRAIRLFLERVRKFKGRSVRHWFITERGDLNGRFHFHGVLFDCDIPFEMFYKLWKYGYIDVSVVRENKCMSYITTYITKFIKTWFISKDEVQKIYCSPGIGRSYVLDDRNFYWHRKGGILRFFTMSDNGYITRLPRYYREWLFSERELYNYKLENYFKSFELPSSPFVLGKRTYDSYPEYVKAVNDLGGHVLFSEKQIEFLCQ